MNAIIVAQDTGIERFKKTLHKGGHYEVLNLYRKCRSEDTPTSFWFIYIILLDLIGERPKIDEYLKKKFPTMRALDKNDRTGEQNTLLVAIRDSFTHKATYSGRALDIDAELARNIDYFRNIARQTVADKLGIKLLK